MTTRRDHLSKADAVTVTAIKACLPALAAARELMNRFHRTFRIRDADALAPWLIYVNAGLLASLKKGVIADLAAATAPKASSRPG